MKTLFSLILAAHLIWGNLLAQERHYILDEEFDDNENEWEIMEDSIQRSEIRAGNYVLQNSTKIKWSPFTLPVEINYMANDFVIKARLHKLNAESNDGKVGIMWGSKGVGDFNAFVVHTSNDAFSVLNCHEGEWSYLVKPERTSFLNYGNATNELALLKMDGKTHFFINEEMVAKIDFQPFYGDHVGFFVGPGVEVEVDNLVIYELDITSEETE